MNTDTPPPRLLNVLIVEDDPLLRDDFARTVAALPSLRLLGSTGSAREALRRIEGEALVDVLLVDLGLPDGDGVALIQPLLRRAPTARVLVISVFGDEQHVLEALAAGAHGYLLKEAGAADLARAIHDVLAGDAPLSPRIARHLLRQFERTPLAAAPPERQLSTREAQVLTLVAHGHTGPEIATRLQLSLHTVNTHLRNCYAKLGANNRVQAVNKARDSRQLS